MTKGDRAFSEKEEDIEAASGEDLYEDGDEIDPNDIVEVIDLDDNDNPPMDEEDEELEGGPRVPGEEDDVNMGEEANDADGGFFEHTDSVYSIAFNPRFPELVITGGGDDRAFIWNRMNGTKLFELKGHTDTVLSAGFNFNGELAATGSMDGTVKVWNVQTGALMHTLEGPGDAIEWIQWHQKGSVLLAGSADGNAWMWASSGQCMAVFSGHRGPVTCGEFTPDGKRVVTGSDDGSVRVWNPKTTASEFLFAGHGFHDGPVNCVSCHPTNHQLVISGSQDKSIKLSNITTGKVVSSLIGHTDSVEAVGFSDPSQGGLANLAGSGSVDGTVRVWDINTLQARQVFHHEDVVTKLQWRGAMLYTCSADKTIRLWDARQGTPVRTYRGHHELVLNFAISPDSRHLISVSDDNSALVFTLPQ